MKLFLVNKIKYCIIKIRGGFRVKKVKWLEDAVFYEIYPQSFYDSNNDGIGDINGIIQKLDYIKDLGCNAIWMNPCYDSPFKDAGYDVRDYKLIAPRYGTNDDLRNLANTMHEKGMHLLLDLVPCHTSDKHPWFIESSKQIRNEYSGRYIWTDNAFNKPSNLTAVGGEAERNGTYVISYFNSQPSLNYGFSKVTEAWQHSTDSKEAIATQDAMIDVIKFWLAMGVDGFRVDMAACLVKNDDGEIGTMNAWKRMFSIVREEYPEAVFVSEWSNPKRTLECGFNIDFYLDHGWDGGNGYHHILRDQSIDLDTFEIKNDNSYFKTESTKTIHKFLDEYLSDYAETKEKGYISFITDNHDMIRTAKFFNEAEIRVIYGFIFTMPGVPFLYYGDELGMRYLEIPTKEGGYHRTGSRTPMQWNHDENLGFSKANKEDLYLPVDSSDTKLTVLDAISDKNSVYYYIKELISLRHQNPSLQSKNNFEVYSAEKNTKLFAYKRDEFLIVLNPSNNTECLALDGDYELILGVGEYTLNKNSLDDMKKCFILLKRK